VHSSRGAWTRASAPSALCEQDTATRDRRPREAHFAFMCGSAGLRVSPVILTPRDLTDHAPAKTRSSLFLFPAMASLAAIRAAASLPGAPRLGEHLTACARSHSRCRAKRPRRGPCTRGCRSGRGGGGGRAAVAGRFHEPCLHVQHVVRTPPSGAEGEQCGAPPSCAVRGEAAALRLDSLHHRSGVAGAVHAILAHQVLRLARYLRSPCMDRSHTSPPLAAADPSAPIPWPSRPAAP